MMILPSSGHADMSAGDNANEAADGQGNDPNTSIAPDKMGCTPFKAQEADFERQSVRILRRMCEAGAVLAHAPGLESAIVLREGPDGKLTRTAVVKAELAEAMALREWIACCAKGRVARYRITARGRAALERALRRDGFDDPAVPWHTPVADQHRAWGERTIAGDACRPARNLRVNFAESPLMVLARRRDRNGVPFLDETLVLAGERLREDFEIACLGPRVTMNWQRFLTGGTRVPGAGAQVAEPCASGAEAARRRVADALAALGPGLGDIVLRCCCWLEGLEASEQHLGWSARSGKVVLRIALQNLLTHYRSTGSLDAPMIGKERPPGAATSVAS